MREQKRLLAVVFAAIGVCIIVVSHWHRHSSDSGAVWSLFGDILLMSGLIMTVYLSYTKFMEAGPNDTFKNIFFSVSMAVCFLLAVEIVVGHPVKKVVDSFQTAGGVSFELKKEGGVVLSVSFGGKKENVQDIILVGNEICSANMMQLERWSSVEVSSDGFVNTYPDKNWADSLVDSLKKQRDEIQKSLEFSRYRASDGNVSRGDASDDVCRGQALQAQAKSQGVSGESRFCSLVEEVERHLQDKYYAATIRRPDGSPINNFVIPPAFSQKTSSDKKVEKLHDAFRLLQGVEWGSVVGYIVRGSSFVRTRDVAKYVDSRYKDKDFGLSNNLEKGMMRIFPVGKGVYIERNDKSLCVWSSKLRDKKILCFDCSEDDYYLSFGVNDMLYTDEFFAQLEPMKGYNDYFRGMDILRKALNGTGVLENVSANDFVAAFPYYDNLGFFKVTLLTRRQ